jgi:small basic protein (TIGR04137 family)
MSLHRTLKGSTKIRVKRNVLKRYERIDQLMKEGKWKEGDKVFGLPKVAGSE